MARRRGGNALLAIAAGFGSGYLTGKKQKEDKERQDKLDKGVEEDRQARIEERQYQRAKDVKIDEQDAAYIERMAQASQMKKGELIDQSGAKLGITADDFAPKIDESLAQDAPRVNEFDTAPQADVSPEQRAQIASIYATAAKRPGAEKWLSSDAPDAMFGQVRPTAQADIYQAKASAAAKLGVRGVAQAEVFSDKAMDSRVKDLQNKILNPSTTMEDIKNIYSGMPDDRDIEYETDATTGRLTVYSVSGDGTKEAIGANGFSGIDAFKQFSATLVADNPTAVMALMDKNVATKRQDKIDARVEKKENQEIEVGASDLKVKTGTEAERIAAVGLTNRATTANINQSNTATAKTRQEIEDAKNGVDKPTPGQKDAQWLANPDVPQAQKDAYFTINGKEGVVQNPLGGYVMTERNGQITAVDRLGKRTVLQKARNAPSAAPPPAKQSTYSNLYK